MKNLNFFSPYQEKKKQVNYKYLLAVVLAAAVAGGAFYTYYSSDKKIDDLNSQITTINNFLTDPDNLAKVEQYNKATESIDIMEKYLAYADPYIKTLNSRKTFTINFLTRIEGAVPANLKLINLDLADNKFSINGMSNDKNNIAIFLSNLKKTGLFDSAFITEITKQGVTSTTAEDGTTVTTSSGYSFNIVCDVKAVSVE